MSSLGDDITFAALIAILIIGGYPLLWLRRRLDCTEVYRDKVWLVLTLAPIASVVAFVLLRPALYTIDNSESYDTNIQYVMAFILAIAAADNAAYAFRTLRDPVIFVVSLATVVALGEFVDSRITYVLHGLIANPTYFVVGMSMVVLMFVSAWHLLVLLNRCMRGGISYDEETVHGWNKALNLLTTVLTYAVPLVMACAFSDDNYSLATAYLLAFGLLSLYLIYVSRGLVAMVNCSPGAHTAKE